MTICRTRSARVSLVFVLACLPFASADVTACGDKYIRLAARLGPAYMAEHRATVLIYMPADSIVPAAARKLRLRDSLERAGHRVHAVDGASDLDAALRMRSYDVVVADAAAAAAIQPKLHAANGRPTLLPVFHNGSRELDAARRQSRCLIASGDRAYHAPAEIDHVMELRRAGHVGP